MVTSEIRPLPTVSTDGTPYEPVFLDDSHLAFLQARDGSEVPHVYVVNIDSETQETYQLTAFLVEIGSIKYHAASQILGFSASVYDDGDLESVKAKDESAEKKDSGMVYDGLPVRFWNTYLPPKDKKNNIFVVPVAFDGAKYIVNGAPVNLLKGTGMVSEQYIRHAILNNATSLRLNVLSFPRCRRHPIPCMAMLMTMTSRLTVNMLIPSFVANSA